MHITQLKKAHTSTPTLHTHTHAHTPHSHTHTPLSHANTLDTDWPAPLGPMMPTTALGGIHENKIK